MAPSDHVKVTEWVESLDVHNAKPNLFVESVLHQYRVVNLGGETIWSCPIVGLQSGEVARQPLYTVRGLRFLGSWPESF
jgi:hypothetical protein